MYKRIPNIITTVRLAAALTIFFVADIRWFMAVYFLCAVGDMADGFLARRFNAVTLVGARLDSLADLALALSTIFFLAVRTDLFCNRLVVVWVVVVALIRVSAFAVCRIRFGVWASFHTTANKIAGALLFVAVPICLLWESGRLAVAVVAGVVAAVSALEELLLASVSKQLDVNRRSLLVGNHKQR